MKGGMTVEKKKYVCIIGRTCKNKVKKREKKEKKTSRVGRPAKYTKNNPRATMTLAITANHRDKIKLYAIQNHTTVSELFMQWIDENCK